jgi:hypothetical protein
MKVDYFSIGPSIGNNYLNRVIFLSDTMYYMQTYAKTLILNNSSPTNIEISLDSYLNKGLIYSSEQSSACYQLSTYEIRIGDALTVTDPMKFLDPLSFPYFPYTNKYEGP